VPKLFDRQFEVVNCSKRAILVSGPRKSGKTIATLHRLIRAAWETRPDGIPGGESGARIAVFSRTLKNAKDGGVWDDIIKLIIPEWIQNCPGFQFTTYNSDGTPGPKVDGQTRTPFFRITNKHGGEAEFKLFSLDHDPDIEDKVKEQRFSHIYFSELDKFKDRRVLSVCLMQLRMKHLRRDEQFWIADTNPSEEGEDSWIYEVWYQERLMEYKTHVENSAKTNRIPMDGDVFKQFQSDLQLIEIKPEENPFLDPAELLELKSVYSYDPDLYARFVLGKWVLGKGAAGRHFAGYFVEDFHVLGECSSIDRKEWLTLVPAKSSYELITGWDLGDTNHSAHIIDKVGEKENAKYYVLDELVSIGVEASTREFTEVFVEKLKALEEEAGKTLVTVKNWSDRSSIDRYNSTADTFQYLEVLAASDNRLFLTGVTKGAGSVRQRVRVIKRLLHEKRLFVSAHCVATIAMLKLLRKGETELSYVVSDKHKHPFDSLTYALLAEVSEDLEDQDRASRLAKRKEATGVFSI
jgi:PBSX family phage terminase large subunit